MAKKKTKNDLITELFDLKNKKGSKASDFRLKQARSIFGSPTKATKETIEKCLKYFKEL